MFESNRFELGLMAGLIKLSDVINEMFSAYEEAKTEESANRMFDASFAYANQLIEIIANGDCSKLYDPKYDETEDGQVELMNNAVSAINNLYLLGDRILTNSTFSSSPQYFINAFAVSLMFESIAKALAENPMFEIWKRMGKFDGHTIS